MSPVVRGVETSLQNSFNRKIISFFFISVPSIRTLYKPCTLPSQASSLSVSFSVPWCHPSRSLTQTSTSVFSPSSSPPSSNGVCPGGRKGGNYGRERENADRFVAVAPITVTSFKVLLRDRYARTEHGVQPLLTRGGVGREEGGGRIKDLCVRLCVCERDFLFVHVMIIRDVRIALPCPFYRSTVRLTHRVRSHTKQQSASLFFLRKRRRRNFT